MSRTRAAAVSLLLAALGGAVVVDAATGAGAAGPRAEVAADLSAELRAADRGQLVPAIVVLRAQADRRGLPPGGRKKKQRDLVHALRDTAGRAQLGLRAALAADVRAGTAADVTPLWIVDAISLRATPSVLRGLAARADVARIDPDRALAAPAPAETGAPEPNIARVNAPALWDLGFRGAGVVVANLDTGVDATHPDLATRWRGGTNSWYDPYGEHPTTPTDVNGHGTATMGVMVGGSAGGTAIGMAPDATWIAVKIFNDHGTATSTAIHLGLQWLLDPDGNPDTADAPDVVNNSWTMSVTGCHLDFAADLANLRTAGILPVFSAGNFGPAAGTVASPADNPDAFPVGSVDGADVVDPSSSRGPSACDGQVTPRLVAPGVAIHTTDLYGLYTDLSGTSLAAPHVAGALALLLSAFPDISADRQASALVAGAADLGPAGPDTAYGYGRLDVAAAYQWLASTPDFTVTAAPATLTVASGAAGGATVTVGAVAGFAGPVAMGVTGPPAGVGAATVTPATVTVPGTAQLSVTVAATAVPGRYPLTVTGTSGGVAHSATVTLVVPPRDFTLAVTPASRSVAHGKSTTYTATVAAVAGFTGAVTITVTGLPAGATKTVVPNPVTGGHGTATITVKTATTTKKGTYHLTVTATSGTIVHRATVTLVVT